MLDQDHILYISKYISNNYMCIWTPRWQHVKTGCVVQISSGSVPYPQLHTWQVEEILRQNLPCGERNQNENSSGIALREAIRNKEVQFCYARNYRLSSWHLIALIWHVHNEDSICICTPFMQIVVKLSLLRDLQWVDLSTSWTLV